MNNSSNTQLHESRWTQALPYILILFAIVMRFLPHPPNFAPVAALALFAGTYLGRRNAILIPLGAMIISDIFLGFHSTMPYVYGSFIVIAFLGTWLKKHMSFWTAAGSSLAGSILFFIVTNFGSWLHYNMYPHTIQGLAAAYIAGIPFYRNTLLGDLFYAGTLFGLYALAKYVVERRIVWTKA